MGSQTVGEAINAGSDARECDRLDFVLVVEGQTFVIAGLKVFDGTITRSNSVDDIWNE